MTLLATLACDLQRTRIFENDPRDHIARPRRLLDARQLWRGHEQNHADTIVESSIHLGLRHSSQSGNEVEYRRHGPGRTVQHDAMTGRKNTWHVLHQSSPRDVSDTMDRVPIDENLDNFGIDPGRLQELFTHAPKLNFREDLAHQRKPV